MRYMFPRQFWERGSRFEIYDEDRRARMSVREAEYSWDHHWTIEDLNRKPLAYANQELVMSSAEYVIFRDDQPWASIPGSAFDSRIDTLRLGGPCEYALSGLFWKLDYSIKNADGVVATVGQHRWTHANMVSLETLVDDDLSLLLIVMTVEQILHG